MHSILLPIIFALMAAAPPQKLTTTQPTVTCDPTTLTTCAPVTAGGLSTTVTNQPDVTIAGITAAPSGPQTGTNSDSVVCATDARCIVAGAAADGAPVSANPVRIAGKDGSGNTQDINTDTDGNLQIEIVNSPSVVVSTFPDNEPINVAQINGVTPLTGNGATGTGSQRVTIASDNSAVSGMGVGATGAAPPANANFMAGLGSGATGGFLTGIAVSDDQAVVNISTATTTLVITGVSGRHVRIGAINLVTQAANNIAFISGTGATCGTSTAGMNGGTTAASGWNIAANDGIAYGTGFGTIMRTIDAGDSVCIITSASTQLSGTISFTIY